MNQQFYIAVNGQQTGPFTYEELKAKGIQRDTLLWTEGLDSWTKAEHVALVKDIIRATPPPLPNEEKKQQTPPPPPPIPQQQATQHFGYELASIGQRFFAHFLQAVIIVFIAIFILFIAGNDFDGGSSSYSFGQYIAGIIISALFGAMFYSMWSGNLGHKILGLKVISSVDGSDQNKAGAGALREGLKYAMSIVLIPVIWLLFDSDKQNLYDKMVKTYVVKKKEER